MFSGIIEEKAKLLSSGTKLVVQSSLDHTQTKIGDSIAINGVCLTVVKIEGQKLTFDLSQETIRRTTFATLSPGADLNLERSLVIGERLHGHFVYGHVDTVITLLSKKQIGESIRFEWELPPEYRNYIVEKGSVALSGISLTVAEINNYSFSVYAIPHTLELTTLSTIKEGDKVNLEVDMLARFVQAQKQSGVTLEFLKENGFIND